MTPVWDTIPQELRDRRQWVCWKFVPNPDNPDKPKKLPFNATTGKAASSTDPGTWSDFGAARAAAARFAGIGYVFAADDPYLGVDIDHCCSPDGELTVEAQAAIGALDSYTERSVSGSGVHIIVKATKPDGGSRTGNVEMYDRSRYFVVTGDRLPGTRATIQDRDVEIRAMHARLFPPEARPSGNGTDPTPAPAHRGVSGILAEALAAENGTKLGRLYAGDLSEYGGDESRADLALCGMLAFWTQDLATIDALFRQSGLMRDKWDSPRGTSTYGAITIAKALAGKTEHHKRPAARQARPTTRAAKAQPQPHTATDPPVSGHPEGNNMDRTRLHDVGNGERLIAQHGRDLRYCYKFGAWFVWDGIRWAQDEVGEAVRLAKLTARGIYAEASSAQDNAEADAICKHARRSQCAAPIAAMLTMAQSEPGIPIRVEDLDRDPYLLTCANGTIDLRTGELRPARREDLITKCAAASYDPCAVSPTWDAFLERVLPDPELRQFVQRIAGYSLTGDVSEQCLFFLHGSGANGKSTLIEALRAVAGDYGHQSASDLLINKIGEHIPVDVAALRGRRFVATVEVEEGKRLAESLTKQLTGGDRINARFMRQDPFEFDPTHKIWLCANHKPVVRGTDHAIWRRIHVVPFDVTIPETERDPDMLAKLKTEANGILQWALAGAVEWHRARLRVPAKVREKTEGYRDEMDVLGRFIEERCLTGKLHRGKAGDIYRGYCAWCVQGGERPTTQQDLGRRLKDRGYPTEKIGGTVYRFGIDLMPEAPPDPHMPYKED